MFGAQNDASSSRADGSHVNSGASRHVTLDAGSDLYRRISCTSLSSLPRITRNAYAVNNTFLKLTLSTNVCTMINVQGQREN